MHAPPCSKILNSLNDTKRSLTTPKLCSLSFSRLRKMCFEAQSRSRVRLCEALDFGCTGVYEQWTGLLVRCGNDGMHSIYAFWINVRRRKVGLQNEDWVKAKDDRQYCARLQELQVKDSFQSIFSMSTILRSQQNSRKM